MLVSMTGFGSQSSEVLLKRGSCTVAVEVKSLNARFFEATCKLPSSLNHLEVDILNLAKKKLLRGRVFLTVRVLGEAGVLETLVPTYQTVEAYLAIAKQMKKKYKISGELSISDAIALPNLFSFEREQLSVQEELKILKVIEGALDFLHKARVAEGKSLGQELDILFKLCQKNIKKIDELSMKLIKSHKAEISKLVATLNKEDDQERIKLEGMYSDLNRMDIAEEISRFSSHLVASFELLKLKQLDKGRRFDFILQELLRETNTIASKCTNYSISSCAVDIKVDLEKIREQVQNIV